jgi:hypothetical protein
MAAIAKRLQVARIQRLAAVLELDDMVDQVAELRPVLEEAMRAERMPSSMLDRGLAPLGRAVERSEHSRRLAPALVRLALALWPMRCAPAPLPRRRAARRSAGGCYAPGHEQTFRPERPDTDPEQRNTLSSLSLFRLFQAFRA